MKINELLEAAVTPYEKEEIDPNTIIDTLQKYCSQALASMGKKPLARFSTRGYGTATIIDPSAGVRRSQNTSNHYTLIMDHSPYMTEFPRRSKSIICHSVYPDYFGLSGDRNVYMLYPFDNTTIGVCPDSDLWDTLVTIPGLGLRQKMWNNINDALERLGVPASSFKELYEETQTIEFAERYNTYCDNLENPAMVNPWYTNMTGFQRLNDPSKIVEHIFNCMRPEDLGITAADIGSFNLPEERECWFSGPCVAINRTTYNYLIENGFFNDLLRRG